MKNGKFDTNKVLSIADSKVVPFIIPRAFQKKEDGKLEYDHVKVGNCEKALCWDDEETLLHKAAEVGDCAALDACIGLFENGKNFYSDDFGRAIIKCLQTRNKQKHTPIDIDQGLKNY